MEEQEVWMFTRCGRWWSIHTACCRHVQSHHLNMAFNNPFASISERSSQGKHFKNMFYIQFDTPNALKGPFLEGIKVFRLTRADESLVLFLRVPYKALL